MSERLKQWWFWCTLPWRYRHLPQCYRNALTGLACCFDGEPPPPVGKVWKCELFIDPEHMGLGMAQMQDAQTGNPAPEMEWVIDPITTTANGYFTSISTRRVPKKLGGFKRDDGQAA